MKDTTKAAIKLLADAVPPAEIHEQTGLTRKNISLIKSRHAEKIAELQSESVDTRQDDAPPTHFIEDLPSETQQEAEKILLEAMRTVGDKLKTNATNTNDPDHIKSLSTLWGLLTEKTKLREIINAQPRQQPTTPATPETTTEGTGDDRQQTAKEAVDDMADMVANVVSELPSE